MSFSTTMMHRRFAASWQDQGLIQTDDGDARDGMWLAPIAIADIAAAAQAYDMLVTTGGASVGDHDLIQQALGGEGFELGFWKIAMRPGKPLIWGRLGRVPVLGLPGNPVSAFVCAHLFLRPMLRAMQGNPAPAPQPMRHPTRPWPAPSKIDANRQPMPWRPET